VTSDGYIYVLYTDSTINENWGIGGDGAYEQMPNSVDGTVYRGQEFDGIDDYIFVEDSYSLRTINKGSVSFWFNLTDTHDSTNARKIIFCKTNLLGTNGEVIIGLNTDGKLRARLYDGLYHTAQSSQTSWDYDCWYYVTMIWDTSATGYGIKLYVNDTLVATNTDNNYVPNNIGDVRIGIFRPSLKYPFEGKLDEIRIADCDCPHDWINASYNTIFYQGTGAEKFIYMGNELSWWDYLPAPPNLEARTFSTTQINLFWEKAERADITLIRWDTSIYPLNITDGNLTVNSTGEYFPHTGLIPATTYYYTGWSYNATNNTWSYNYSFAFNTTFSTDAPNEPQNLRAITLDQNRILLTWSKAVRADYTYIRYDTSTYPTTRSEGNFSTNTTASSFIQIGLLPYTTYYFSAWSFNASLGYFSVNYSFAYNTTLPLEFIFTNETPYDNATNVSFAPTLCITVNHTTGGNFNLSWYVNPDGYSSELVYTHTNITNGTYCFNLSSLNDSKYAYYNWVYYWEVLAFPYETEYSESSGEFSFTTESYTITFGDVNMNTWLIVIWIIVWAICMAINIRAKSTTFGIFAGLWLFMLGLSIIITGVQVEAGTITTTISPGQSFEEIQYASAVYPYSAYSVIWGVPFLALAIYIAGANVIARRRPT
jgi:hypothetical protein